MKNLIVGFALHMKPEERASLIRALDAIPANLTYPPTVNLDRLIPSMGSYQDLANISHTALMAIIRWMESIKIDDETGVPMEGDLPLVSAANVAQLSGARYFPSERESLLVPPGMVPSSLVMEAYTELPPEILSELDQESPGSEEYGEPADD